MPSPTLKPQPGAGIHRIKWLLLIAGTAFYVLTLVSGGKAGVVAGLLLALIGWWALPDGTGEWAALIAWTIPAAFVRQPEVICPRTKKSPSQRLGRSCQLLALARQWPGRAASGASQRQCAGSCASISRSPLESIRSSLLKLPAWIVTFTLPGREISCRANSLGAGGKMFLPAPRSHA